MRSDGRPTYNFASPVEDMLDGITHVIRGNDHVSNTPTQINILRALGAELPVYAHVPDVLGDDGKKLSKRHGAVSIDAFREAGYLPAALMNFLALLGWSYDDKTTVMQPEELIERFSLERVGPSPATFDYEKLDWLNGVHLRGLDAGRLRDGAAALARRAGDRLAERARAREAFRSSRRRSSASRSTPTSSASSSSRSSPTSADPEICEAAAAALAPLEPWRADAIEATLRALAERLGEKPRQAFQPIRLAITGSTVSPGLFESLELLGRDESLARLAAAYGPVDEQRRAEQERAAGPEGPRRRASPRPRRASSPSARARAPRAAPPIACASVSPPAGDGAPCAAVSRGGRAAPGRAPRATRKDTPSPPLGPRARASRPARRSPRARSRARRRARREPAPPPAGGDRPSASSAAACSRYWSRRSSLDPRRPRANGPGRAASASRRPSVRERPLQSSPTGRRVALACAQSGTTRAS